MASQTLIIDSCTHDWYLASDANPIILYLKDESGSIVGSLYAMTLGCTALAQSIWFLHPELHAAAIVSLLEAAEAEACRRGCGEIFVEELSQEQQAYCLGIGYKVVNEFIHSSSDRTTPFLAKNLPRLASSLA